MNTGKVNWNKDYHFFYTINKLWGDEVHNVKKEGKCDLCKKGVFTVLKVKTLFLYNASFINIIHYFRGKSFHFIVVVKVLFDNGNALIQLLQRKCKTTHYIQDKDLLFNELW